MVWRALSNPTRTLAIPAAPPNDFDRTLGWWAPCIDLMIYELGWQSPARALTKWMGAGRPPTDVRLSLIETVWGRHLDAMPQRRAVHPKAGDDGPRAEEQLDEPRKPCR